MSTRRIKVYIAAPLSKGDRKANVQRAMAATIDLVRAGFAPLCPHLTDFVDPDDSLGHSTWIEVALPWVASADCVLRLSGESAGADAECEEAKRVGIPIYTSLSDLKTSPPALGDDGF